ncbi:MAG: RDD family protein [Thermoplasmatota archaeon]
MDDSGEDYSIDYDSYPMSGSYWPKRVAAYFVDLAMVFFVLLLVFLIGFYVSETTFTAVAAGILILLTGILTWILKAGLEYAKETTPGKSFLGLTVISGYGKPSFGELLLRNLSMFVIIIGSILDMLIGMFSSEDSRQKFLDRKTNTMVVEEVAVAEELPRRRYAPPPEAPPEPPEKVRLGFPGRVKTGNCPRCGAPYRILDPGDDSFSGLWNYRCTWCNHKVFERERS